MSYGKKSNDLPDTGNETNDFVSCSFSDKTSDTNDFANWDSSDKSESSKSSPKSTHNSADFFTRVAVDESNLKTAYFVDLSCHSVKDSSFSHVKNNSVSNFCCDKFTYNKNYSGLNKSFKKKTCFVCGSAYHLIKDCDFHEKRMSVCTDKQTPRPVWNNVNDIPPFVPHETTSRSKPAGKPVSADKPVPAGKPISSSETVPVGNPVPTVKPDSAGRPFSAGWKRKVAWPYFRPTSHYFQNDFWPVHFDPIYMGKGRWDSAVKSSAGCSWRQTRQYLNRGSKNNGGSHQSTWFNSY